MRATPPLTLRSPSRRLTRERTRAETAITVAAIFGGVVLPAVSPLRATRTATTAILLPVALPIIVAIFIYATGIALLRRIHMFQFLTLVVLCQAGAVGLLAPPEGSSTRAFLSHTFQLVLAFVLYGAGHLLSEHLSIGLLRRVALMFGAGFIGGTALTIVFLGAGDVPRYYSPSYAALLPLSYSAAGYRGVWSATVMGALLIANKRAVLLAGITIIAASSALSGRRSRKGREGTRALRRLRTFVIAAAPIVIIAWAVLGTDSDSSWGPMRAARISLNRITPDYYRNRTTDVASAGRASEAESALATTSGIHWIVGHGSGWTFEHGQNRLQNLHVSPVSLAIVFGIPYTVLLYLHASASAIGLLRRSSAPSHRLAALYVLGGLVHSLFAYSLFVDVMFFLLLGAVVRFRDSVKSKGEPA